MTEQLGLSPSQTVGPYGAIGLFRELITPELVDPADPRAIRLYGTLIDGAGEPVPDGMVEIWQANTAGRYAHPADDRSELELEDGFLGFGRSATPDGRFEFVTVKPGPVPWPGGGMQAPHIEVGVFARGLAQANGDTHLLPGRGGGKRGRPGALEPRRSGARDPRRGGRGRRASVRHPAPGAGPHDVLRSLSPHSGGRALERPAAADQGVAEARRLVGVEVAEHLPLDLVDGAVAALECPASRLRQLDADHAAVAGLRRGAVRSPGRRAARAPRSSTGA